MKKSSIILITGLIGLSLRAQFFDPAGKNISSPLITSLAPRSSCTVNGISITTLGTINGVVYATPNAGTCSSPNAFYNGGIGAYTGFGTTGFVRYTFSQSISSVRISYSAINGPNGTGLDVGQLSVNGGGTMVLSNPCGATIGGMNNDVLTCNISGGVNPFGDVNITVSSSLPFTEITLTNIGGQTGWVEGNPCNFIFPPNCPDTNCYWTLNGNTVSNNNFIGTKNNQDFKIQTNGLERMTVEANGNVGINNINPSFQVQVGSGSTSGIANRNGLFLSHANAAYMTVKSGTNPEVFFGSDNTVSYGIIGTFSNHDLGFRTNNTERMTLDVNGRLGVGIPAPVGTLDVARGTAPNGTAILRGTTRATNFNFGATEHTYIRGGLTNSNVIINDGGGSVGIATATPLNTLHVEGGARVTDLPTTNRTRIVTADLDGDLGRIDMPTANQTNVFLRGDGTFSTVPNNGGNTTNTCNTNNTNFVSKYNGANSITCSQIWDNGTSVGIGLTNPNTQLHTTGIIRSGNIGDGFIRLTPGNATQSGHIEFYRPNGTRNGYIGWNANNLEYRSENNANHLFSGGSVVVNATSPRTYTGAGVSITGSPTVNTVAHLDVNGLTFTNTLVVSSDAKLKKDIKTIENALEMVIKLDGKTYTWENEKFKERNLDNIPQAGYLAQEVEKVFPTAVVKDNKGFYAMNYNAIIPVLSNAIKELNAKVEKQNNAVIENEALKTKIASLEERQASYDEKFALLEKTIAQLCESGCAGLEKKTDVDVLYQSIPNPTDSEALINYYLSREYSDASISIYTQDGKAMKTIQLEGKKGNGSIKINLSDLSNGTYIYTLVAGERVIDSKKLQIVK